jgi:hypothetical protein
MNFEITRICVFYNKILESEATMHRFEGENLKMEKNK